MSITTNTFEITDKDIQKAQKLLSTLNNPIIFDEDSKNVIRQMDSCFVQACPGSGKTTTLVAKLSILADKLPQDYKGICVLSHTNVAKDIIKSRLGNKADKLFKYPNFIGTIQSFVDTYLAIPAMIEGFKVRPEDIDDSRFAYKLQKNLYNGTFTFLTKRKVNFEGIDFDFENIENLNKYEDLSAFSINEARHYNALNVKSKKVKREGTITFNDAFALANWYIKKHPEISESISKRFPYVFIDEVQDTSENQIKILTSIFKNSRIQYLGDNNQNLYNPDVNILGKIEELDCNITVLPINNSYRLSPRAC